jgi:hypothetical protein
MAKQRMARVVRKHHPGINSRKIAWPHKAKGGKDACDFMKTEEIPGEDGKFRGGSGVIFGFSRLEQMTIRMDEAANVEKGASSY